MSLLTSKLRLLTRVVNRCTHEVSIKRTLPLCTVDTNATDNDIPPGFELKLSKKLAEMLNKPEKLMSVSVNTGVRMCRGGDREPTMTVHIWSVGVFDADRNPAYSKQLYEFFNQHLPFPEERIAVFYHPIEKQQAGHLLYAEMIK